MMFTAFLISLAVSCNNASDLTSSITPDDEAKDSGLEILQKYQEAYTNQDLVLLTSIHDSSFLHHLLEQDWADYDGDGEIDTAFNRELELVFTETLFSNWDAFKLELSGEESYIWPEDPSGESIAFPRSSTLTMWNFFPAMEEIEYKDYIFVCTPDSTDTWYLTHLFEVETEY